MQRMLERFMRAPEGGGNGGGDPGPGGGSGGGDPGAAAGGKGGKAPAAGASPYYPAGLPDEMKGSDDRATIDGLFTRMNGLREAINKVPRAPGKASEYKLSLDEKIAAKLGDVSSDPFLKKLPEIAHKHGLAQDAYQGFVADALAVMSDLNAYAPQPSNEQLAAALIDPKTPEAQKGDALKAANERITNARTWVDGHKDETVFNTAEKAELLLMTQTPGGLSLLEKMMAGTINNPVATGGRQQGNQSMADIIDSRLRDERGLPHSGKYDKAFAEETRRMQIAHYGI